MGKSTRQSLHRRVAAKLRAEIIRRYQPGDRLEAESRLAERFGVSVLTLREGLSSLAQEGLIARRHGSGTYVLDRRDKQFAAVVIELDISHPATSEFFLKVTQGLRGRLEEMGFMTRLYVGSTPPGAPAPTRLTCPELARDLEADFIRGVAAIALPPGMDWRQPLDERKIPVVGGSGDDDHSVVVDMEAIVERAVGELVAAGRRRLAYVGGGGPAQAFRRAVEAAGLEGVPGWSWSERHPSSPDAGWDGVMSVWSHGQRKPDGLVVGDAVLFDDAAKALLSLGTDVPGELLVASHAIRGCGPRTPIPVVRFEVDTEQVADEMATMLAALMRDEPVETGQVVVDFDRVEVAAFEQPHAAA